MISGYARSQIENRTQAISLVATHSKHDSKVQSKGFQLELDGWINTFTITIYSCPSGPLHTDKFTFNKSLFFCKYVTQHYEKLTIE